MPVTPDDRRKIWRVMELLRELKKDKDLEVQSRARCAERDLEVILEKLNARGDG